MYCTKLTGKLCFRKSGVRCSVCKDILLIDQYLSLDQYWLMSGRDICTDSENNFISLSTEMDNSFNNHLMTNNVPGCRQGLCPQRRLPCGMIITTIEVVPVGWRHSEKGHLTEMWGSQRLCGDAVCALLCRLSRAQGDKGERGKHSRRRGWPVEARSKLQCWGRDGWVST